MKLDNERIISFWGSTLVKIPASALEGWAFSKLTRDFLQTIGLPVDPRLQEERYTLFQFTPDDVREMNFQDKHYLSIGILSDRLFEPNHYAIAIEKTTAQVFLVPFADSIRQESQFLNTTIQSLLLCLQIGLEYRPLMQTLSDQEEQYRSEIMRQSMRQEDCIRELHVVLKQQRIMLAERRSLFLRSDARIFDDRLGGYWYEVFNYP